MSDRPAQQGSIPGARRAARERAVMRRTILGLAVVAVVAAATLAVAATAAPERDEASPAATVRSLLITGLVDDDGFDACQYLTFHERAAVGRAVGEPHTTCATAIPFAHLVLGRTSVDLEAAAKRLGYHVQVRGPEATVTVTAGGASHTFRLKRAGAAQRAEFRAPPTPWRIDSGVASLVRH